MFNMSAETMAWIITALVAVVFVGFVAGVATHWLGVAELSADVQPHNADRRERYEHNP
jgi:multisubunit Na+/H+ antiporter MnhG subunit